MSYMTGPAGLSVVGLGKLGLPLAACLAASGFDVVGVDRDERRRALADGSGRLAEPGLDALLAGCTERLATSGSIAEAVLASELTFVVVPTPSGEDGGFSTAELVAACETLGAALAEREGYHVVVVTSTVMPGAIAGPVAAALERTSGRRVGRELGLCYSPAFIALGSVIHDLLNPDFLLVGESDVRAGDELCSVYAALCENAPPLARMSFVNAELAKLSLNSYLTMKISFANMLGAICEGLPGADVEVVTSALRLDSRVGAKYLRSAVSYGGPCFPRDNRALAATARAAGVRAGLAEATDAQNAAQLERLCDRVLELVPTGGAVAVLGLAYKPGTEVVEHSAGLLLSERLAAAGIPVSAYDPAAAGEAARLLAPRVRIAASLSECVSDADAVVLATPWPEFADLTAELGRTGRRPVIVDCWRMLDPDELDGCTYVRVGSSPAGLREPVVA